MKICIKKMHPQAVIPRYSKPGDAAMDIVATSANISPLYTEYGTGLSIEVPEGFVALLYPRSSITNKGLILGNSVGVIDSGYRGEIKFRFYKSSHISEVYGVGERIGQIMIMPYPTIEFEEVQELCQSDRGTGGFGSTGN